MLWKPILRQFGWRAGFRSAGTFQRRRQSAQQDEGRDGSWVHAYLHRKEGDQSNAAYWYSRAGKPICREPLETEWLSIVDWRGFRAISRSIDGGIPCSSDCMAEGETFEPSTRRVGRYDGSCDRPHIELCGSDHLQNRLQRCRRKTRNAVYVLEKIGRGERILTSDLLVPNQIQGPY
jgi:hypothetical protein